MTYGTRRRDARTCAGQARGGRSLSYVPPVSGSSTSSCWAWSWRPTWGAAKTTWFRLARPVIVAGAIVIYYLTKTPVATRSGGLAFELALAALGIVLGLAAGLMFRVFRDRGIPWSRAGVAYALLWIVVVGARIGFAEAASRSHSVQVWWARTTSPPMR